METEAGGRFLFIIIISCKKFIDGKTSLVYEKRTQKANEKHLTVHNPHQLFRPYKKNDLFIIRKKFFNGEGGHFLFLFFIFRKSWFFQPLPQLQLSGIHPGSCSHHPKPKSPKTSANDVASAHTTDFAPVLKNNKCHGCRLKRPLPGVCACA